MIDRNSSDIFQWHDDNNIDEFYSGDFPCLRRSRLRVEGEGDHRARGRGCQVDHVHHDAEDVQVCFPITGLTSFTENNSFVISPNFD